MAVVQPSLFPPGSLLEADALSPEALTKAIRERILGILLAHRQPTAGELLTELETALSWRVRQLFPAVVRKLAHDPTVAGYLQEYIGSVLCKDEIDTALRGSAKPTQEFKSTVDDLVRKSTLYRTSDAFRGAIEFAAGFRDHAPFNNMLVRIQNPSCAYYATEKDWDKRFGRRVKEDARPMLILAPMHPVMLVYDLDSTEGPVLPDRLEKFAKTEVVQKWNPLLLQHTLENVQRDHIAVQWKKLSSTHGGFVTPAAGGSGNKMRIVVHDELDEPSRYGVLCHELAHVYLGHLGSDQDGWWPSRINLTHASVEIEAEAVSYIVSVRAGLRPSSDTYLCSYLTEGKVPESVSLELIAKVAGRLEEMGTRKLPLRKEKK